MIETIRDTGIALEKPLPRFQTLASSKDGETIQYEDGTVVEHEADYDLTAAVGSGVVKVFAAGQYPFGSSELYPYTGRGVKFFLGKNSESYQYIPSRHLSADNVREKTVLVINCGFGTMVDDLCSMGARAFGTDVYFPPLLRARQNFLQGSSSSVLLAPSQIDLAFSTFDQVFHTRNSVRGLEILRQMNIILKPGGSFIAAPADHDFVADIVREIPGLRILPRNSGCFCEVQKIAGDSPLARCSFASGRR